MDGSSCSSSQRSAQTIPLVHGKTKDVDHTMEGAKLFLPTQHELFSLFIVNVVLKHEQVEHEKVSQHDFSPNYNVYMTGMPSNHTAGQ